eukprot:COSAG06_NODE_18094_length_904_cov_1.216149_2_plen_45_part_01
MCCAVLCCAVLCDTGFTRSESERYDQKRSPTLSARSARICFSRLM